MDRYITYCTPEQVKKALELGAPIKIECFSTATEDHWHEVIPTAEQMIGWLEEQGVFISIVPDTDENTCANYVETKEFSLSNVVCSSRKEATLAAIDAALEYLTKNKK